MPPFIWKKTLVPLLVCGLATACASVNPVGLAKLAAFDPLSGDPSQLAVAARLPQALKLRDGDLILRIKIDAKDTANKLDEMFLLDVTDSKPGDAGTIVAEVGERLQTAKVANKDLARLTATQDKTKAYKAQATRRGEGSLDVAIAGGCKTAEPSPGPLLAHIYIKTDADTGYFPLASNMDLRKQFTSEIIAKIAPCG